MRPLPLDPYNAPGAGICPVMWLRRPVHQG